MLGWGPRSRATATLTGGLFGCLATDTLITLRAVLFVGAGEQIEHSHADRDAVGDLIQNQRAATVGNLGRDFDPTIHRPRMHDDGIRRRKAKMVEMQTVMHRILAHRRKEGISLTLALHAEDHHYIGIRDCVLDASLNAHTLLDQVSEFRWYERAGAGDAYGRPELCQQIDVRSRHARMQDVANDRDL